MAKKKRSIKFRVLSLKATKHFWLSYFKEVGEYGKWKIICLNCDKEFLWWGFAKWANTHRFCCSECRKEFGVEMHKNINYAVPKTNVTADALMRQLQSILSA